MSRPPRPVALRQDTAARLRRESQNKDDENRVSSLTSAASQEVSEYMQQKIGECEATRDMYKEVRRSCCSDFVLRNCELAVVLSVGQA